MYHGVGKLGSVRHLSDPFNKDTFFFLISLIACAIGFPESLATHNGMSYYPPAFSSEAGK